MLAKPNWNKNKWFDHFICIRLAAISLSRYALHIYRTDGHRIVPCTCNAPSNYCKYYFLHRCRDIDTIHILWTVHHSGRAYNVRTANLPYFPWNTENSQIRIYFDSRKKCSLFLLACDAAAGYWIAWTSITSTFYASWTYLHRFTVVAVIATKKQLIKRICRHWFVDLIFEFELLYLQFTMVAGMPLRALGTHIIAAHIRAKSESIIASHLIEINIRFTQLTFRREIVAAFD